MWLEASLYPSHANTPKFFYVILFCSLGFCRHISPIPVSYLQDPSFILGVNEASSPNLCDTGSCITMACVLKAKNLYLRSLSSGLYICPWGGGATMEASRERRDWLGNYGECRRRDIDSRAADNVLFQALPFQNSLWNLIFLSAQ